MLSNLLNRMHMAHTETALMMGGFFYETTPALDPGYAPGANPAHMRMLDTLSKPHKLMSFGGSGIAVGVDGTSGALGTRMLGDLGTGGLGAKLMSGGSVLFSAYSAYQGYKGNMSDRSGFYGMMDALSIDYSTMLAVQQFAGPRATGIREVAGTKINTFQAPGAIRSIRVGLGGAIGASVGNAILGPAGSIIGGLGGGAIAANPLVAGLAVAGATAGYGTYQVLKSAHSRGRDIRMSNKPHTSGDMSSFFTQNAFTMRSQAVQAMRNSHLNARTALGQEATFMHTNKNYFSTYR